MVDRFRRLGDYTLLLLNPGEDEDFVTFMVNVTYTDRNKRILEFHNDSTLFSVNLDTKVVLASDETLAFPKVRQYHLVNIVKGWQF